MPRVCAFDPNETLLDLAALDPIFWRAFGDRYVRPLWFAQMLQSALVAALTNSTRGLAEAQLAQARIRDLFEEALSADEVSAEKPAPEPYRMAAERFGVPISQVRLVAGL